MSFLQPDGARKSYRFLHKVAVIGVVDFALSSAERRRIAEET
jgi:hypothetical protein